MNVDGKCVVADSQLPSSSGLRTERAGRCGTGFMPAASTRSQAAIVSGHRPFGGNGT